MKTGDVIAGRFCIERFIARGGMGEVYRAVDEQEGGLVAIKRMFVDYPHASERLALEARALIELTHPAIVRYVGHEDDPAVGLFLAMEWLDGTTLSDRLKVAPLSLEQSLDLAARVAEGLGVAHARGMLHRDIKPGNIMLVDGRVDRPKILDFGIARLSPWQDLTGTGIGPGTPAYMSPEQICARETLTPAADVFALGCMLFKCVTGQTAYRGHTPRVVLAKIATMTTPPRARVLRPQLPAAADELLARMMAYDPADRPASGAVAAVELRAVLDDVRSVGDASLTDVVTAPQLTTVEQRPFSVIFAELAAPVPDTVESVSSKHSAHVHTIGEATTLRPSLHQVRQRFGPSDVPQLLPDVRQAVEPYGASVELLLTGAVVARLRGGAAVTDLASRTARCALALHMVIPDAAIGVAMGRAVADNDPELGAIIEAAAALARPGSCALHVDTLTRELLPARFELAGDRLMRERARERPAQEPPRKLLGRVTRCVGRSRLIRQLEAAALGCAEDRQAHAVVVVGEAGVGKSRLRAEVVSRLHASDASLETLAAWGDPMRAQVPYGLLARMLRQHLELPAEHAGSRIARNFDVRTQLDECERVIPFMAELMGIPVPRLASPALRAARRDPALMAEQKRRAFEDWLAAECAAQPVLLVLDDLQWADTRSIELLAGALRRLRDAPFLLLAFARPGVHDRFPTLADQWKRQEIHLDNLRPADSATLARDALGDEVSEQQIARIVERSAGNPFYLEEMIRVAAAGDLDRLPDTVLAGVQLRIGALPAGARRILRAASIYGRTFWTGGLLALLGADAEADDLERWLALLKQQEIVHRRPDTAFPGHEEWQFRHDLVRESVYEMLVETDRVTGHRLAGQWLQENGETDAVVLAEHYAGAGAADQAMDWYERAAAQALDGADTESRASVPRDRAALVKAAGHYRRAADIATSSYANDQAILFYSRAVAMYAGLDADQTLHTLLALAEVQARVDEWDGLRDTLERADRLARELDRPRLGIVVVLHRAEYEKRSREQGALTRALALANEARDRAHAIGATELEARAYSIASGVLQILGGADGGATAIEYAERALDLLGDAEGRALGLWRLGNAVLTFRNDPAGAAKLYNRAIKDASRIGADALVADCLTNLAMAAFRQWNFADAVSLTERALDKYRELAIRNREFASQLNLGTFSHYLGQPERAQQLLQGCLPGAESDWLFGSNCHETFAIVHRAAGDESAAQASLRAALDLAARASASEQVVRFLGELALSLWTSGSAAESMRCVERALGVSDSVSRGHAILMVRTGPLEEAIRWLEHHRTSASDPDARLTAELCLSRIHWWRGAVDTARELCGDAMAEVPTTLQHYWLPASILLACLDGDLPLAADRVARARDVCPRPLFDDALLDVATLCASLPLDSDEHRDAAQQFLDLSQHVADHGLRFRVDHLRGEVFQRLGQTAEATACAERARTRLALLEEDLAGVRPDLLASHPWAVAIRDRARASS